MRSLFWLLLGGSTGAVWGAVTTHTIDVRFPLLLGGAVLLSTLVGAGVYVVGVEEA